MEPGRFFYSINGTDVHGPVTDGDVRQLWLDNRIGPSSFLCRAGDVTWAPCDPADYPARAPRVRTMVIVPSKMFATLLATENSPLAGEVASSSVALLSPSLDDFEKSKRVTIRLTSPPEVLAKAPEVSRSRSLRGALVPKPVPARATAIRKDSAKVPPPALDGVVPLIAEARSKPPSLPEFPPLKKTATEWAAMARSSEITSPPPARRVPSPSLAEVLSMSALPLAKEPAKSAPAVVASPRKIPSLPPTLPAHAKPAPVPEEPSEIPEDETPEDEKAKELGAFAIVLNLLAVLAVLGAAGLSAFLVQPQSENEIYAFGHRSVAFIETFLLVLLIPFVVSRFARGDARVITRSGGMVVLAVVVSMFFLLQPVAQSGAQTQGALDGQSQAAQEEIATKRDAQAQAMTEQQKEAAQKEIATKGYYTGNTDQAEQNIEKLKSQLTDDSERSRIGRAILAVTTGLLDKVKASDAVQKTCKFTLDAVKSADDLAARGRSISQLHDTQADVIRFLQNYDQQCRDALNSDNVAAATQDEVIASAHQGAHVDLLVALWQEKMKLSDDYVARFDFLRKNWGGWEFKAGDVIFKEDAKATAYDTLVQAVQDDIAKIHDTQRQIFQ
jgi:hypothetical protein